MPANLDIDQTVEIIKSADLEDVIIMNENYECILHELPDNEDITRIVTLKMKVQERIAELS